MKTTLISKENNIAKFTMEFTAEEFDAAIVKAYQNTKDRYTVDGFRKGKAPRKVIEARYGEGVFFEDAVNDMFAKDIHRRSTSSASRCLSSLRPTLRILRMARDIR